MGKIKQKTKRFPTKIVSLSVHLFFLVFYVVLFWFHAPWKLLVILIFPFITSLQILPKGLRQGMTWITVLVFIISTIWILVPRRQNEWQTYSFETEISQMEVELFIPDTQNAAMIYNNLLLGYLNDNFDPNEIESETFTTLETRIWNDDEYPQVSLWIDRYARIIQDLPQLLTCDKCQFELDTKWIGSKESRSRRKIVVRNWVRLLLIKGNRDIALKQYNDALLASRILLQIGKHYIQQADSLDYIRGLGYLQKGFTQLSLLCAQGEPATPYLNYINQLVLETQVDWLESLQKFLQYDTLSMKNALCGLIYEIDSSGKTRFSQRWPKDYFDPIDLSYSGQVKGRLAALGSFLSFPTNPEVLGHSIDKEREVYEVMCSPDYNWNIKINDFSFRPIRFDHVLLARLFVKAMEPSYDRMFNLTCKFLSQRNALLIILTVIQYKNETSQWPSSLEVLGSRLNSEYLIDPINRKEFVYHIDEDDFRLYSKGLNAKDDGGMKDWESKKDDILFWPMEEGQ